MLADATPGSSRTRRKTSRSNLSPRTGIVARDAQVERHHEPVGTLEPDIDTTSAVQAPHEQRAADDQARRQARSASRPAAIAGRHGGRRTSRQAFRSSVRGRHWSAWRERPGSARRAAPSRPMPPPRTTRRSNRPPRRTRVERDSAGPCRRSTLCDAGQREPGRTGQRREDEILRQHLAHQRLRVAPSANRVAISFRRPDARATSRFATFEQATRSTIIAAPSPSRDANTNRLARDPDGLSNCVPAGIATAP